MGVLFTFTLFFFPFYTIAAELDNIPLLTPLAYEKSSVVGQTLTSQFLAKAAGIFDVDIEKKILEKLSPYKKELQAYFPQPGELDSFVKKIVQEGIKKNLSEINDKNLIAFSGHIGNQLIGQIAERILEKEGVKESARRALWARKITAPFNKCIDNSLDSQFQASHCIDALTASLIPSVGVGIVYELSRSTLNPSQKESERFPFNQKQVASYVGCIEKTKKTATDVKDCALLTMKEGVFKVTLDSLESTLTEKKLSSNKIALIKKKLSPPLDSCLDSIETNSKVEKSLVGEFLKCVNNLIAEAGVLVVEEKIATNQAVQGILSANEVKKLALTKSAQFRECANLQKKKSAEAETILETSSCENVITNEITFQIVSETFRKTARNSSRDKNDILKTSTNGIALLNQCWKNDQSSIQREACLKKSIISFSKSIAILKLEDAIPSDMPDKKKDQQKLAESLGECLRNELPENISESPDLNKKIDLCSNRLSRVVALSIAEFQIKASAKNNLPENKVNELVKTLVHNDFSKCIGPTPGTKELNNCSDFLTLKAAKEISEAAFKKEIADYLKYAHGPEALGVTQEEVDSFSSELNKKTQECIEKVPGTFSLSEGAMDKANRCIKNSVREIAFYFGKLKFNQSIGNLYTGREKEKESIETQFFASLGMCLDNRADKKYSIDDYTKNLFNCSGKITTETTSLIAEDQINFSLEHFLKDRPGIDLKEKRKTLKNLILTNFNTCLEKSKEQNKCIDSLKKEATRTIVVNFAKIESKEQLNSEIYPRELNEIENNFLGCTDSKLEGVELADLLDECTKTFALDFAKTLGELKLNFLLRQALGSEQFSLEKPAIDDAAKEYNSCLLQLKKIPMSDGLTDKLSICTNQLTRRGLNIVKENLRSWMNSDEKDQKISTLKNEFAAFFPCLSTLLPSTPYSEELQTNIDSSLKPVALLLSQYIEYNPDNAKTTLQGIIQRFAIDLEDVAQTKKAKIDLLNFLYKNGALDQFLKAMVRGTVQTSLQEIPAKEMPEDLRKALLKKESFDEIFATPDGLKIKEALMEKILKPALIDNVDLKDPSLKISSEALKDDVIKLLINAPSFGEQAIKMSIQNQISNMNSLTKFFAKTLYGSDSLVWEKVRQTEKGKEAEAFIKNQVLTPKFKGVSQSSKEQKKIMKEAEDLVRQAVKSYR